MVISRCPQTSLGPRPQRLIRLQVEKDFGEENHGYERPNQNSDRGQ